jgi:glycosyltransferase involved in cell wall biosynthesis
MKFDDLSQKKCVSIIVFYKNVGNALNDTIAEILYALEKLSKIDYQIVLVDDGSTESVTNDFEISSDNFVKVRLNESLGISGAILAGVEHAIHEDILIIPGHDMYDFTAIINVISLLGSARIILGSRNNLDSERPFAKRVASRIMRDLYRHIFYYFVGDIHGLAIYQKADIKRFLRPTDGHAQGILIVTNVLNEGGLLVQTLAPIKLGHKISRSKKLSNNFPSLKQVYKIIYILFLLKKEKNKVISS